VLGRCGIARAFQKGSLTIYENGVTSLNLRRREDLGPGIPNPSPELDRLASAGHHLTELCRVVATPILKGLHHEYRLTREAAGLATMQARIKFADHTG